MRDVLVVGPPRSGTSLVASLLVRAGLHVSTDLMAATETNPRGFVESVAVNECNDDLLEPVLERSLVPVPRRHAWLAALPADVEVRASEADLARIRRLAPPQPAVVKDPRLCYTLDPWRVALAERSPTVAVVVRHPGAFVSSLRRETEREVAYYDGYGFSVEAAITTWQCMAERLLDLRPGPTVGFVDYDDLVDGAAAPLRVLSELVGVEVDGGTLDPSLRRSRPDTVLTSEARDVHAALRARCRPVEDHEVDPTGRRQRS